MGMLSQQISFYTQVKFYQVLSLSLVSLLSSPLNLILRFNHYQRKTDAKALSLPQIFRKTGHWLAGDLSENLSSTVPEKVPRTHLPICPLRRGALIYRAATGLDTLQRMRLCKCWMPPHNLFAMVQSSHHWPKVQPVDI